MSGLLQLSHEVYSYSLHGGSKQFVNMQYTREDTFYYLLFFSLHFSTGGPPQNVLLHTTFSPGDPPKTQIFRNFSRRFPFQNLVFSPKNPHFFAKKVVLHRYTIHTCHRC